MRTIREMRPIREITTFLATDGTKFLNYEEACNYQIALDIQDAWIAFQKKKAEGLVIHDHTGLISPTDILEFIGMNCELVAKYAAHMKELNG